MKKHRFTTLKFCVLAGALAGGLAAPVAQAGDTRTGGPAPSGEAMAFDAMLVRPLGLVGTLVGTAFFVVSLPFSILGGNVDDAAQNLVVKPAKTTFVRPLGEFD